MPQAMRHIILMLNDEIKYCGTGHHPNTIYNIQTWFWDKFETRDDCLVWTGPTDYDGYGIVDLNSFLCKDSCFILYYA